MRAIWQTIWLGLRLEWYRSAALRWLIPIALGIYLCYQGHSPYAFVCLGCGFVLLGVGMLCMSRGVEGGCYLGGSRAFRLGQMIVITALAMLYAERRMGDGFSLSRAIVAFTRTIEQGESSLSERLHRHLSTTDISPEVQQLMGAIALGYLPRGGAESEGAATLRQEFVRSGGAHILVVSGFHLGVVAGLGAIALSALRRFRWGRAMYFVSLLVLTWGFVFLTGGAPATIRAAIILSLVLIGRWLFLPVYLPNILAVSALLQLLIEPTLLYNVGMWLSYMAVLSISIYAKPLATCVGPFRWRAMSYLWQAWAVGIGVQVYVLPLVLYAFGAASWSFIWTGVPLVLLSTLLIPLSLLIYMLGWMGVVLPPLDSLAELLGQWMLAVARFGSQLVPLWQELRLPLGALIGLWILASLYPLYKEGYRHLDLMRY